jgi:methylmalonyl-CoA mutase cobalamin-binding subunit
MSPLLIPLIGPIMNGLISLVKDPGEFAKDSVRTKTTKTAVAVAGAGVVAIPSVQTEDQAITAIITGLATIALALYKKHK